MSDDSTNGVSRRRCLVSVGAGVAALAGPTVGSAGATTGSNGKLVFVYDDGYQEDYTQTFLIHQEEGVPGCLAIPSANVDRGPAFLTEEQVTEMTDAGWEVMSHGVSHEALGSVTVVSDVEPDDTRVYVDSTVPGRTPHEVEIFDAEKRAVASLTGRGEDDAGGYLTLESSVGASFGAEDTRVRFTEEVVRRVLSESRRSLGERGFDVTNFVLPYGSYDQRTLELLPEYYQAVANVRHGGINGGAAADPYRLGRAYFRRGSMTEAELTRHLDRVAKIDGLAILGGHSRHPKLTGERIRTAIRQAKERDIAVVTLRTALQELGIVPTPTATPTPTHTTDGATPPGTPSGTPSGTGRLSPIDAVIQWLGNLLKRL